MATISHNIRPTDEMDARITAFMTEHQPPIKDYATAVMILAAEGLLQLTGQAVTNVHRTRGGHRVPKGMKLVAIEQKGT